MRFSYPSYARTLIEIVECSGPLISPAAKSRVEGLIQSCVDEGGIIHLDGRGIKVKGYENGNFVGPTVLEASVTQRCYKYVQVIVQRDLRINLVPIGKRFLGLLFLSSEQSPSMTLLPLSMPTSMGTGQRFSHSQAPQHASLSMKSTLAR